MTLKQPREWYYYHNLRSNADIKTIRKEYSRVRKAFNKALRGGFRDYYRDITDSTIKDYPILKGLSESQIKHYLAEMINLSASKGFTAAGRREQRNQAIDTLRARGVKGVNRSNWTRFVHFADTYYEQYGVKYSDDALRAYDAVLRRKGSEDQFLKNIQFYEEHVDELLNIPVNGKKTKGMLKAFEIRAEKDIYG